MKTAIIRSILGIALLLCLAVAAGAANGGVTMSAERPAYDAYIDEVRLEIVNQTGEEVSFGLDYRFQRLNNGVWEDVKTKDDLEIAIPSIAQIMTDRTDTTINLSFYRQPFAPGRYRIVKNIMGEVSAEFEILSTAVTPRLSLPDKLTLTCADATRSGSVMLDAGARANVYGEALTGAAHELLGFRKTTAPAALPSGARTVKAEWVAKRLKTMLTLTQAEDAVYLQMGKEWYRSDAPGVMDRLFSCVEELGGFVPQTGDALIAALQKTDELKNEAFTPMTFSAPLAVSGWKSNGGISIFQYPDATSAQKQARYISEDGNTIGIEQVEQGAVSFHREEASWPAPPHFYHAGSRLVLYCGTDEAVMDAIERVLGPQFAGAERGNEK